MSEYRFMRYFGTNFYDAETVSKDYPSIDPEKVKSVLGVLETVVDYIITKDFFKVKDLDFLKKEDIACSLIHSIVGGQPQKSHWDYRPEDVSLLYSTILHNSY